MKKVNYIYMIFLLVFVSLLSEGLSWNNMTLNSSWNYDLKYGKGSYNAHRSSWELYNFDYDYSSHDWIADEALRMTQFSPYAAYWTDENGKPFWDGEGRRRKIFLYATAGPDWGNVINIRSKLNVPITAKNTKALGHHYYFSANKNPWDPMLGQFAEEAGENAIKAIKQGDCDLGAFYLGILAHYMADACLYAHTFEGSLSDAAIEKYMETRMDSCPGIGNPSSVATFSDLIRYEFLEVSTLPAWVFPLEPDRCARVVAYESRYDSDELSGGQGQHNALWMDGIWAYTDISYKVEAKTRADWTSWYNAMPVGEQTNYYNLYHFFTRLEENVDFGVWYTANAMTYVIQKARPYKCALGVQDLKTAASKNITLGMMFMLMSYLGISLVEFFMRSSSDSVRLLLYTTI